MSPYRSLIKTIQRLFKPGRSLQPQTALHLPVTEERAPIKIPRADHNISRKRISKNALKVLYKLHDAGYQAYIVGGGVRDLLLGRNPKDFDVATNAHPDEVKSLFRNCRLIGRRFRLAHVHFGPEIIEVATFRAHHLGDIGDDTDSKMQNGMIVRDNVYGSFEEDAARRDFTVNALYYNIADFSVVSFHDGMADLKAGVLRLIGDPIQRYREDPVRMLRAARFAAKLGFRIEPGTADPLPNLASLLEDVPASRLYDETLKLFLSGYATQSFRVLRQHGLFAALFPLTEHHLRHPETEVLLEVVFNNTDQRVAEGKSVTPAFLFAALLWGPYQELAAEYQEDELSSQDSEQQASHEVFRQQRGVVGVPKRIALIVRDIWVMQERLLASRNRRAPRLLSHPMFRAGFDFLLLRGQADPALAGAAAWWNQFYHAEEEQRGSLLEQSQAQARSPETDADAGTGVAASANKRRRGGRRRRGKAKTGSPPASG